jgi:uncharacterized protein with GYD domain
MPTYILLSALTPEGRKTIMERPDRIDQVNKEMEALGVKVVAQFMVLGPYDFINIVEAPNNETIAHLSVELGSRGTIKILSMPAISRDKWVAFLTPKRIPRIQ